MAEASTRRRWLARAAVGAAAGLLALGPWDLSAAAKEGARGRPKGVFEGGCRVQAPQKFLERRSFVHKSRLDPAKHGRAVRYMAEHYGHVDDDVTPQYNAESAQSKAKTVSFEGMPISVHAKIAPALACVDKYIQRTCTGKRSRYTPKAIGGFRSANTYRGAEISNHLFGVAVDVDPEKNPCCGCVDPWPSNPLCKNKGHDVFQRTAVTRCWVKAFEHFGFDWLGHDELEDTMHFEFLGDPDHVTK
jgi:D-alanyl-D-alanine carboxypeptidase